MFGLEPLEAVYASVALLFQLILVVHFSVRRWRFETALRYGWIVYGLGPPYAALSVFLLLAGAPWWMWAGGFLYLVWAVFGFTVEYLRHLEWRRPVRWAIFVPYLTLYLATTMFYWWPLARVSAGFWGVATALFITATILNVGSHRGGSRTGEGSRRRVE